MAAEKKQIPEAILQMGRKLAIRERGMVEIKRAFTHPT